MVFKHHGSGLLDKVDGVNGEAEIASLRTSWWGLALLSWRLCFETEKKCCFSDSKWEKPWSWGGMILFPLLFFVWWRHDLVFHSFSLEWREWWVGLALRRRDGLPL
ncbi:hypothetical protein I3760_05G189000 [Carya illinoinensis]|nr:hypothetical protein I3760_05G189000 [Carya illinoinensis]